MRRVDARLEGSCVASGVVPLADGRFWAAGYWGVGYWDGEKWSLTSAQTLGGDGGTVEDIAGDAAGAIWVLAKHLVFRNEGGGFLEVPGAPRSPRNMELVRTPDGGIAVNPGTGRWRVVPDICCDGMEGGRTFDLGSIDVSDAR